MAIPKWAIVVAAVMASVQLSASTAAECGGPERQDIYVIVDTDSSSPETLNVAKGKLKDFVDGLWLGDDRTRVAILTNMRYVSKRKALVLSAINNDNSKAKLHTIIDKLAVGYEQTAKLVPALKATWKAIKIVKKQNAGVKNVVVLFVAKADDVSRDYLRVCKELIRANTILFCVAMEYPPSKLSVLFPNPRKSFWFGENFQDFNPTTDVCNGAPPPTAAPTIMGIPVLPPGGQGTCRINIIILYNAKKITKRALTKYVMNILSKVADVRMRRSKDVKMSTDELKEIFVEMNSEHPGAKKVVLIAGPLVKRMLILPGVVVKTTAAGRTRKRYIPRKLRKAAEYIKRRACGSK